MISFYILYKRVKHKGSLFSISAKNEPNIVIHSKFKGWSVIEGWLRSFVTVYGERTTSFFYNFRVSNLITRKIRSLFTRIYKYPYQYYWVIVSVFTADQWKRMSTRFNGTDRDHNKRGQMDLSQRWRVHLPSFQLGLCSK